MKNTITPKNKHLLTNHCTLDQSLALKEIGFDEPTDYVYGYGGYIVRVGFGTFKNDPNEDITSAPTRSEVLQWAREKHGIDAWVRPQFDSRLLQLQVVSTSYVGYYTKGFEVFGKTNNYDTHPEAESALVDKIIEPFKENKE